MNQTNSKETDATAGPNVKRRRQCADPPRTSFFKWAQEKARGIQDEQFSLGLLMFLLAEPPQSEPLARTYQYGGQSADIIPSVLRGGSALDSDLLTYSVSLLAYDTSRLSGHAGRGEDPPRTLDIDIHDFLRQTGRDGGRSHIVCATLVKDIIGALGRLAGTCIDTRTQGFKLFESFKIQTERANAVTRENGGEALRVVAFRVTPSEWLAATARALRDWDADGTEGGAAWERP